MTTIDRITTTKRVPMDRLRKTSLAAGALYLLTFVSIPTLAVYGPVRSENYIIGSGPDTSALWGGALEMIVVLASIGTAIALYPVVRRQNEAVALGFVGSRALDAAAIITGVACLMSVVTLHQAGAGAPALATGHALVAMYGWTLLLGQTLMPAMNALLVGSLLFRSRLVPRILPLLGLIGAPLLLASTAATFFGFNYANSIWSAFVTAPIALWESSLGIWLVVKGFKSSPSTAGPGTAGPPSGYSDGVA